MCFFSAKKTEIPNCPTSKLGFAQHFFVYSPSFSGQSILLKTKTLLPLPTFKVIRHANLCALFTSILGSRMRKKVSFFTTDLNPPPNAHKQKMPKNIMTGEHRSVHLSSFHQSAYAIFFFLSFLRCLLPLRWGPVLSGSIFE